MTLFRHGNVGSPEQVRSLCASLQSAADGGLLIAADQEGGQFIALGDGSTAFAGNMALGAVDDVGLTERVGRAIGAEARAMGVNVVYAPVLDIASNPLNPPSGSARSGTSRGWSAPRCGDGARLAVGGSGRLCQALPRRRRGGRRPAPRSGDCGGLARGPF